MDEIIKLILQALDNDGRFGFSQVDDDLSVIAVTFESLEFYIDVTDANDLDAPG